MNGDPGTQEANWSEFIKILGLHFDDVTATRMTGWFDAGAEHHQPFGLVHGGVYCAIVETFASIGGTVAVGDRGQVVVGVSNTTDFIRPHRSGRIDIVGEPIHVGRTQQLWEVRLTRASDGKLVARGQVRLHNVAGDAHAAPPPPE